MGDIGNIVVNMHKTALIGTNIIKTSKPVIIMQNQAKCNLNLEKLREK